MGDWFFVGGLLATIAAILVVSFALVNWGSSVSCEQRWPDRNPSYTLLQGCMIDTDEGRIPASNYRVL
jgi:hypothetical protein